MQLNYQKIKKFIPAVLILAGVLIFIFASWPAYQQFKNLQANNKTKQQEFLHQQKILQESKNLANIDKLDKILPDKPEIPELIVQLEALASENGMILKSINFNKDKLTAQVQLAGKYQAFKKYLQALESNLRLLDITNLSFQDNNFNLFIKAYHATGQKTENIAD